MRPGNRIEQILKLLQDHGPMSTDQLSELVGISHKAISFHILMYRKHGNGIRISGYDMSSPTRKSRIYELGDEPDLPFPVCIFPSRLKARKYPGMSRKEVDEAKRREAIADDIKPFRDPMLFLTAGVSP